MIKFFRSLRKRLLSAGQTGKYLKYAIGEIALVMIGILLALQVNNWNEGRKENNLEQTYLVALKQEFQDNLKNIFREPELKKALASLDGLLLRIRFQETNELADVRMKISELAQSSNVSARKMAFDAFGGMFKIDGGQFPHSNLSLLKSVPFDNRLTRYIFTGGFMNQRYTELKDETERIITIIDNQIKP